MKTYIIKSFSAQDSWEIFRLMLINEKFDDIVEMVKEGHKVNALLLEALSRLKREDILKRILSLHCFYLDETTKPFLVERMGEEEYTEFSKRLKLRVVDSERGDETLARIKKESRERERKEKLSVMMEKGLYTQVFDYAEKYGLWQDVFECFGQSAVYSVLKPHRDKYPTAFKLFKYEVYWQDGDFTYLKAAYLFRHKESVSQFCAKVVQVQNGAAALYDLQEEKVDEWLCENGYKSLFSEQTAENYRRLARCHMINDAEWEDWYQVDPENMLDFAGAYGLVSIMEKFKQRKWLIRHGYIWKALTC